MSITLKTPGIHHIALRCADMEITKKFYQQTLGLPLVLDSSELIAFTAGALLLAFKKADATFRQDVFTPFNIGLDHLALTCETEEALNLFAEGLADAGVENTGVKFDETLQKSYVAFKDPDRIQWEFYMA